MSFAQKSRRVIKMSSLQKKHIGTSSYHKTLLKLEKIKFGTNQNEAKKLLKIKGIDNLRQVLTISIFYQSLESAFYSLNYGQRVNIIKAINQTRGLISKSGYDNIFDKEYVVNMHSFFRLFGKNITNINGSINPINKELEDLFLGEEGNAIMLFDLTNNSHNNVKNFVRAQDFFIKKRAKMTAAGDLRSVYGRYANSDYRETRENAQKQLLHFEAQKDWAMQLIEKMKYVGIYDILY